MRHYTSRVGVSTVGDGRHIHRDATSGCCAACDGAAGQIQETRARRTARDGAAAAIGEVRRWRDRQSAGKSVAETHTAKRTQGCIVGQ